MLLVVNAFTIQQVYCPNLVYPVEGYEAAFEMLNDLVNQGFVLKQAILQDGESRLNVPVEAFDGRPIEVHLQELQRQWSQVLSAKPVLALNGPGGYSLKIWLVRLDAYYAALLTHLEKMIVLLQIRKVKIMILRDDKVRSRINYRIEDLLAQNQRLHEQTQESRRKNLQRIQAMESLP